MRQANSPQPQSAASMKPATHDADASSDFSPIQKAALSAENSSLSKGTHTGRSPIEHRHRVLAGQPIIVDDRNKYDLSRILIKIYGVKYTGHPRLTTLLEQNKIKAMDFLSGASEAEAFENGNYVGLHQSTLRKVDVIANLAERAHDSTLTTLTSWWALHGGNSRYIVEFLGNHRLVTGIATLLGLAALAFSALQ
jgi:hypothetical protein